MNPQETIQEITNSITVSIKAGLADHQRYPAMKKTGRNDCAIYIQDSPDLSVSLKDRPYSEVYSDLLKGGAYNLRMIDGALIQMLYKFKNDKLASHRLCVFPSPSLEIYERAHELYDSDELYVDVFERNAVRFPLRFDFSSDSDLHVEVKHPKSHLTLGEYTHCRIPVASPITPARFISFVIGAFYGPASDRVKFTKKSLRYSFPETITQNEKLVGHFSF